MFNTTRDVLVTEEGGENECLQTRNVSNRHCTFRVIPSTEICAFVRWTFVLKRIPFRFFKRNSFHGSGFRFSKMNSLFSSFPQKNNPVPFLDFSVFGSVRTDRKRNYQNKKPDPGLMQNYRNGHTILSTWRENRLSPAVCFESYL